MVAQQTFFIPANFFPIKEQLHILANTLICFLTMAGSALLLTKSNYKLGLKVYK